MEFVWSVDKENVVYVTDPMTEGEGRGGEGERDYLALKNKK